MDYYKTCRGYGSCYLPYLETHKTPVKEINKMIKDNLCSLKLLNRLTEAKKYFTKKEYAEILRTADAFFENGRFFMCEKVLDKLPSNAKLLGQLVERLKGKSVAKTLKLIQEGKVENNLVTAKGLSSLLTHIIIEVEHGNDEYKILVPSIIEKLNEIIYNTLR